VPESQDEQTSSRTPQKARPISFSEIEFPSDALSVKRLRLIFPEQFDEGSLTNGFGHFFYPMGIEKPAHLVQLNDLLSAERTLADYAFCHALETYPNEILDEECHWCASQARKDLDQLYQEFKLADSPETARLLIRDVEEQAVHQGERTKSRSR
jgi:hypothetical protein